MKPEIKLIPLTDIVLGERARATNQTYVDELASSILDNGLLQPIVLRRSDNRLIAGGHRYAAFSQLSTSGEEWSHNYTHIPYLYFDDYLRQIGKLEEGETISDSDLQLLEMEENCQRLDMTWQEKSVGVYRYHRTQVRENRKIKVEWMQETTGKMLGITQAFVSQNLNIGKELDTNPNSPLWKCDSLRDALRFKVSQKLDEALRNQANRIREKVKQAGETQAEKKARHSDPDKPMTAQQIEDESDEPTIEEPYPMSMLQQLWRHGDCLELLRQLSEDVGFDHIITDPPYGIEMDNLDTTNTIERVADTHKVAENVTLLQQFIQVAYETLPAHGFLCMWYDLDHHEKLMEWGRKAGFKVCRWPLVWCKTSPCRNSAAQYNHTKSTEVCMIMRKSEKALLTNKQSNNWITCPAASSKTHPFVKPFDVWERLIEMVSREGQTLVDPFAGEGSMLLTSLQLNRTAFGIEIDDTHINQGVSYLHSRLNKGATVAPIEFEDDVPF